MPLSTIIHTKNAASTLKKALDSVKALSDEIVIVDMQSNDDTLKIAEKYTDRIFGHKDVGYADPARNFGLAKASHDWILVLDADEEVSPGLAAFIKRVITDDLKDEQSSEIFLLPRQNLIFKHWIQHTGWWPDYQIRLFRKGTVTWEEGVHRLPTVHRNVLQLPAEEKYALIHHNYQAIDQFINRLNRYTTLTAKETPRNADRKLTADRVMTTFGNEFFRRFFAEKGVKDGVHGLSLSLLQAMYQLTVALKLWEEAKFPPQTSEAAQIKAVSRFQQDLAFWLADWQVHQTTGGRNLYWRLRRKLKV